MIHFTLGHCNIETNIPALKKFANDTYYRYNKSSRMKHMVLGDERYPNLKVTHDIFSLPIWIMTNKGEEQRIFLDGDVFLNKLTIHTISLDGSYFTEEAFHELNRVIKELSSIGRGHIYAEVKKSPVRYENGKVQKFDTLISEIYNSLSVEKQEEHKILFDSLKDGFSPSDK